MVHLHAKKYGVGGLAYVFVVFTTTEKDFVEPALNRNMSYNVVYNVQI